MCCRSEKTIPWSCTGALPTLRHAIALPTHIVPTALANNLRPDAGFTPGAPVEVDPIPPSGSTSAPPFTFPVWRPR